MNILGVGPVELLLVLIIALIVAGPQRMIRWAYHAGKWTSKMRAMWSDLMKVVQHEIDQAGLDIEVPKHIPTRRDLNHMIESAAKPYVQPVEDALNEVKQVRQDAQNVARQTRLGLNNLSGELKKSTQIKTSDTPEQTNQNGADFGTWTGNQ
jgi:Sec-independent protein translocase protein TatA